MLHLPFSRQRCFPRKEQSKTNLQQYRGRSGQNEIEDSAKLPQDIHLRICRQGFIGKPFWSVTKTTKQKRFEFKVFHLSSQSKQKFETSSPIPI